MDRQIRNTLINSTVAFTTAFFITTLVHECGHFISYLIAGAHPVLYRNYVSVTDEELAVPVRIISALAGPVISLLQGILFLSLIRRGKSYHIFHLFFLWLGLLGLVNFFGYLVMTPLSGVGDTGKAAEMLKVAMIYRILLAVGGFAVLMVMLVREGSKFSCFIPAGRNKRERIKYVYAVMFVPIIIGSFVKTIFAFPVPAFISLIYTATSSFSIMITFGSILKNPSFMAEKMEIQRKIYLSLIGMLILVIIINRLLTPGLVLN